MSSLLILNVPPTFSCLYNVGKYIFRILTFTPIPIAGVANKTNIFWFENRSAIINLSFSDIGSNLEPLSSLSCVKMNPIP